MRRNVNHVIFFKVLLVKKLLTSGAEVYQASLWVSLCDSLDLIRTRCLFCLRL